MQSAYASAAVAASLLSVFLSACSVQDATASHEAPASRVGTPTGSPNASTPHPEMDMEVAEKFVRIGYSLNKDQRFASFEFLLPDMRTDQAAPLIRLVNKYNEFDGERVAAAVDALRGRVSSVEFGREGSPVLYLRLPFWTHQIEGAMATGPGTKISDAAIEKQVVDLRKIFVDELKADEFSVERRRVRVWWD